MLQVRHVYDRMGYICIKLWAPFCIVTFILYYLLNTNLIWSKASYFNAFQIATCSGMVPDTSLQGHHGESHHGTIWSHQLWLSLKPNCMELCIFYTGTPAWLVDVQLHSLDTWQKEKETVWEGGSLRSGGRQSPHVSRAGWRGSRKEGLCLAWKFDKPRTYWRREIREGEGCIQASGHFC